MTSVKPQISKFQADKWLSKWALTCYGGSTHERLLSESSCRYMLADYLFLLVLLVLLCIGGEAMTVSIYLNLMSGRENVMT
jgi:hypothetical protein